MAPAIFGAEVDKRHRAPEQVTMRYRQLLVVGGALPEDVRVDRVPDPADLQRRPHVFGPPMLVPDRPAIRGSVLASNQRVVGLPDVDPVDDRAGRQRLTAVAGVPRRAGQRVDQPHPGHKDRRAEIRHDPRTVRDLAADAGTGGEAKADIILAQRARVAGERVGVAADRAAKTDKSLVEASRGVIQRIRAHRAPELDMAPGLVDARGRNRLGKPYLQWAEKRAAPEAGCRRRKVGRGIAGHRTRSDGRYLFGVDIDLAERAVEPRDILLEPAGEHSAVRTGIGVFDLRRPRPA